MLQILTLSGWRQASTRGAEACSVPPDTAGDLGLSLIARGHLSWNWRVHSPSWMSTLQGRALPRMLGPYPRYDAHLSVSTHVCGHWVCTFVCLCGCVCREPQKKKGKEVALNDQEAVRNVSVLHTSLCPARGGLCFPQGQLHIPARYSP